MSDHKAPTTGPGNLYHPRPGRRYGTQPPEGGSTALELAALPVGTRVADATGDLWTKEHHGRWVCYDATMLGEALLHAWGPVTLVGAAL